MNYRRHSRASKKNAFSRIELLSLLAVGGLWMVLCAPVFAKNQSGSRAIGCIANKQKLARAWASFTADNNGLLPGVIHGLDTFNNPMSAYLPWVRGWMTWDNSTDNTNTLRLTLPSQSSLAPHLGSDPTPFKCPADTYLSSTQTRLGWSARVRSVSANAAVGPGNSDQGPLDLGYYRSISHQAQFTLPSPSDTWLYIDEHPDSINEGAFFPPQLTGGWIDLPASYHDRGAGVAMADGSAQIHRWANASTVVPVSTTGLFNPGSGGGANNPDTLWVRTHSPRR